MDAQLKFGGITMDVLFKDIKNVHLSVYPPYGRVHISAPLHMNINTIRSFAISKLNWIRQQQKKISEQERETPREYLERESHYVWGNRYLLEMIESNTAPSIELRHNTMLLHVRNKDDFARKQAVIEEWYRIQLRRSAYSLIAKWEPILGVKIEKIFVQKMKTKWGGCNPAEKHIRLNTDLAKKPPECLEYVIVHEMIHLLEPTHNARFTALVEQFIPKWLFYREQLNRLPVSHAEWDY
ncbi:MAG: metal-dependent hydrolase [Planctomycetes bacterium GWF2_50_10]|nr:MAG: metal-dependent hydrolase [Planctomycetes bacterium GWF2_50_10]